jgi:hypothetical protein
MALLDADQDLLTEQVTARFAEAIEAVRAGTIFAHEQQQYSRWRRDLERRDGTTNRTTLEQLAREFPDHVGRA